MELGVLFMLFFNRPITPSASETQLIPHYKCRLAWQLWQAELNKKILASKEPDSRASLWFQQAGLVAERLDFLARVDTQLSASHELVQQKINEYLEHAQGDTSTILDTWMEEVTQLKSHCARLELELHRSVSMPERVAGELAQRITMQPSYAFASTCYSHFALAVRQDPQLATFLALDDLYIGIFKHLVGFLTLAFEIGFYFYCEQLPLYAMHAAQAFLSSDKILDPIQRLSARYWPGHELSIVSRLKNTIPSLSLLFFLALQCWSEPFTYQSFTKWGSLAAMMLIYERMSKKASSSLISTLMPQDSHQLKFVANAVLYQLLLFCACIYLYPWMLRYVDSAFLSADNTHDAALHTLGLDGSATPEEIKKKIRDLTRQFHPDHNKDPAAKTIMSAINEAASVLKEAKQLRGP